MFRWIKSFFNKLLSAFKKFLKIVLPIAKQIILAQLKDFAIQTVTTLSETDLSNEEKREAAFNNIKAHAQLKGIEIRDSLINLLVEMAVQYIKSKV